MHSLPEEFLALCRQLGEAQQRCSAAMASQAAQLDALSAEVEARRENSSTDCAINRRCRSYTG